MTSKVMLYAWCKPAFSPAPSMHCPIRRVQQRMQPEKLLSYTGPQVALADDRLQINDEIYYYNFTISSFNRMIFRRRTISFSTAKSGDQGNQLDVLTRCSPTIRQLDVATRMRATSTWWTRGNNYDGLQPAYARTGCSRPYSTTCRLVPTLRAHIDWRWESSWFADYVHNKARNKLHRTRAMHAHLDATSWSADFG